jgi:uncharacterized membrane protein
MHYSVIAVLLLMFVCLCIILSLIVEEWLKIKNEEELEEIYKNVTRNDVNKYYR